MSEYLAKLEFKYYTISSEEKLKLLEKLKKRLSEVNEIIFAYVHGGFIEREFFRDIDIAIWVRDPENSLRYIVKLSTELELEFKIPIDIQILNEAPLPFKYYVLTKGTLLFSKDDRLRQEILNYVIRSHIDFIKLIEICGVR